MDNNNPLSRVLVTVLPLLVIALIAGAAGYVNKKTETAPIPPLPAEAAVGGVRGSVQSVSGDQISILTPANETVTLRLKQDATVEVLQPISVAQLSKGDWINGGAIPHPDNVLALVGLVVVANPVLQAR